MAEAKNSLDTLLVVEDDPGIQSQLRWSFDDHEVIIASSREEAIVALRRHEPSVVLLDLGLPPDPENASEGLATLSEILSLSPQTKVIVVTGNEDRSNAVKAIASGAYDFYQKPIDIDILKLIVSRAANVYQLELENRKLNDVLKAPFGGIIASDQRMIKVCKTAERVSPTDVTVLLLGESGTGKEVFARAIHSASPRADKPFVAINCGAIPENLLESELFGHEKGSFTGADKQVIGKFEMANGGTLFLDEIGDLPMPLQVKLLRFLQERTIERVGGRKEIEIDVRVVCATHQDLSAQIENDEFRSDLYYRISEIEVVIPPLRERGDDTVLLAKMFLDKFSKQMSVPVRTLSDAAISSIKTYQWPGNVREMENKIKRAVIMADENLITPEDLDLPMSDNEVSNVLNLRHVRESAESQAISSALLLCNNNVTKTAEILGITRPTLYDLMEKHGLK